MTDIVERLRRGATNGVLIPCEDLIQAAEIIEQYRADAAYDECTINFLKAGSAAQARQEPLAIENEQLRKTIQLHAGDAMSLSNELDEWRERALAAEAALSVPSADREAGK